MKITVEYRVVELEVPVDLLAMASDPDVRKKISGVIQDALNENGKEGWRLHMSGLTSMPTLVFEREVRSKKKAGAKS